jgi:hypothetical protein
VITEDDWARLSSGGPSGTARRRLHPDSGNDLYLAVRYPSSLRMLCLRVGAPVASEAIRLLRHLPRTRGMDLQFSGLSDGRRELQLSLTDLSLRQVFNPLVEDIATEVARQPAALDSALIFVHRFEHWIRLLAAVGDGGLTSEKRRGLFGELTTLRRLLRCGVDETTAVSSWTGPASTDQDFQLRLGAVEVKTSVGRGQKIAVASERQLDDQAVDRLLLAHLTLDERRGGNGESLNHCVDQVRAELSRAPSIDQFEGMLVTSGYLTQHRALYDEPRYTVRTEAVYLVRGKFPRITERDLLPGVTDCTYNISTAALAHWGVGSEDVDDMLRSIGNPAGDDSTSGANQ